ncbi:MAG: LysR family transcriptional regulator [Alphaproteobacteria bacterium]|nr:LysR family transcriptional regulator [Alphaproteobacteria bacterium]
MLVPNVDQLRSLATVARCGSMSAASELLHRSQSAISIQIKQLEEIMGARLLHRHARGVALTHEGEIVASYANRILGLLHELMEIADQELVTGTVRFGLTEEFTVGRLPHLLREFAEMQRSTEIEVIVAESAVLDGLLREGRLDLALGNTQYMSREPHVRWFTPLLWVGNRHFEVDKTKPLPLVLMAEGDLRWGRHVLKVLDENQIAWKKVYSTTTFSSVFAAVEAGLGITYMIRECLRPTLRVLGQTEGLPLLPSLEFGLFSSDPTPTRSVTALLKLLATAIHNPALSTE